jgi:hypothetical protein
MKHYIHLWSVVAIGLLISGIMWLACEPHTANAHHDRIYTPCDTTSGHTHMSFDEVSARISIMEQEGVIPAGMISRYVEARDGGKGNEDPRFVWARHLEEGQILSLGNWASGHHPELEKLMFDSGLVAEWQLDASKKVRRFDDPYWLQANPLSPSFTVWATLCMANLGYSIPVYEIADNGEWVSNIPEVQQKVISTTTTTVVAPVIPPVLIPAPAPAPVQTSSSWTERWFEAEWNDFPFEETIKLLEERYPPNTSGKHHFKLSVAVEFLRQEGKLKGLDNVWNNE